MGTFNTALYADDTARDVRDQFVELLARGSSGAEATGVVIAEWSESIEDVDDDPMFWLALADTQWKYGCLSPEVKTRAVEVIESGVNLERWVGAQLDQRRAMLAALKEKLLSAQPRARKPRRKKVIEIPSVKVLSPDSRALATAFPLSASPHPRIHPACR